MRQPRQNCDRVKNKRKPLFRNSHGQSPITSLLLLLHKVCKTNMKIKNMEYKKNMYFENSRKKIHMTIVIFIFLMKLLNFQLKKFPYLSSNKLKDLSFIKMR